MQIRLRNDSLAEQRTRSALKTVISTYDLDGLIFTEGIEIDETGYPHSHPILTLNTAHEAEPYRLLAEFIHEQLHWFEEVNSVSRDAAIVRTSELYPIVPVDPPEGAGTENSTRLHLLVCNLEYQALKLLLGPSKASSTIEALAGHHYRWVYRTILQDAYRISRLMHDLWPDRLRALFPVY